MPIKIQIQFLRGGYLHICLGWFQLFVLGEEGNVANTNANDRANTTSNTNANGISKRRISSSVFRMALVVCL